MRRKLAAAILVLSTLVPYSGRSQPIESGLTPLEQFSKMNLEELDRASMGLSVDSVNCIRMVSLAQQLNSDSLLAIGYNWLGAYFDSNSGDNITALEYYYKALPFAIKLGEKRRISSIYFDMATSYFDLNNYEDALKNTLEGQRNLPSQSHPLYYWMLIQYQLNMTAYYTYTNNPDSSMQYAYKTMETNKKVQSPSFDFQALSHLAAAFSTKEKYAIADSLFVAASSKSQEIGRNQTLLDYFRLYLPHLLVQNKSNLLLQEANALINEGETQDNDHMIALGANFLRRSYEAVGNLDSAYYYSRLEAEVNAKIFNQGSTNKIQALELGESLRKVEEANQQKQYENRIRMNALLGSSFTLIIIVLLLYLNNRSKQKSKRKIESAYNQLTSTQSQLIHSEKMASLGELTAGIAHEIQNPLNFVNNFSEINKELLDELAEAVAQDNQEEVTAIITDLKDNEDKVTHHGKRAEQIVKSMLQHSRTGSGEKEPTDINALADEYLRLAYHGFRAKDKSFNADFKLDLDPALPKIQIVPQDIGRVLLNLINNGFQAVKDVNNPEVVVSTKSSNGQIEITVSDNGPGIPDNIKDKIFQPFFTTKPTGEGTGLGLSMSYDIVTKGHGGQLILESIEGQKTELTIQLPIS